MTGNYFRSLSQKSFIYSSSYNNFIILVDFNIEMKEQHIKAFCDDYGLKSLMKQPA